MRNFRFPYYFTGSSSLNDFLQTHYDQVFLAILKNQSRQVETFSKSVELAPKDAIREMLPNCFAFLLPVQAGCFGVLYETKADEMKQKIDKYYDKAEQKSILLRNTFSVIANVLENVFDRAKFAQIAGFEMEIFDNVEWIDCDSFDKCLNHLKSSFTSPDPVQSLLTFFCSHRANFIEKLLMMQKKKIQGTKLREMKQLHLLQYCVLVEHLLDHLNGDSSENIKGFLVREITNFLSFLLLDENFGLRLRETAANFLSMFLKKILPQCAPDIKPFLNKIVSSLISICKKFQGPLMPDFEAKCLSIIKWLVIEQQAALEDEIAKLDEFPGNEEFRDLREKQLEVKYKSGQFSLTQEVEHFLSVKPRKLEGLVALRQHLAEKKDDLKVLFDELSSTLGFSEDGEQNLLHKLVRSLVDYARNYNENEEERAIEAVKCLGEIGNYDLSTMVFISEDHQNVTIYSRMESLEQCEKLICKIALEQMETMLLHHNPRIFESASVASYYMLESKASKGFKPSIFLRPYVTNTISSKNLFSFPPKVNTKLEFLKVLKDEEFSTYKTWIKRLVSSLLLFAGDKILEKVSSAQKSFAELMNPMMLQLLLCYQNTDVNQEIIAGINFFFDESALKLSYPERVNEGSIYINKLAIRQMLKLVECVRMHCLEHRQSAMAKTVKLNHLNIAKAAKHCEAFFTAALHCEIWAEVEKSSFAISMCNKTLQEVMYEAFTAIGISDASDLFVNPTTQRPLFLQLGHRNWQNLNEHDATMGDGQLDGYIKLLSDMGLYSLTQKLTASSKDQKLKAHQYECLWRLSNWDVLVDSEPESKAVTDHRDEFEKLHYAGLKCLKSDDELGMRTSLCKGRKSILHLLQHESLECTQNLYKFLAMAHRLQQIEDFGQVRFSRVPELREKLLSKWSAQDQLQQDFRLIEPVLSQRNSLFNTANIRMGKRTWIPQAVQSNMLHIVKKSIAAGSDDVAMKTIAKLRSLENLTATTKAEMLIKEAQLNLTSNMSLAKHCLKRVLDEKEFEAEFLLRSVAYRLFGELQAENHADDISKISDGYFAKSINLLEKYAKHHNKSHLVLDVTYNELSQFSQPMPPESDDVVDKKIRENIGVFDIVAKYFDREYVARCAYLVSPDFLNKESAFESNNIKLRDLKKSFNADKSNKELGRSCAFFGRNLEIDEREIKAAHKQRKVAAGMAMFYYLRGAFNDPNDNVLSIFRIISIWMANLEDDVIVKMLNESLAKIPSFKFVVALPQLTVRLSDKVDDKSNKILKMLLTRCAIDHPHHTLPLILALVNSYADDDSNRTQDEPRVVGAKELWTSLKKEPTLHAIMRQMAKMSTSLISLANQQDCSQIPPDMPKNLNLIHCPTIELPVMRDANYTGRIISIHKWTKQIESVGGINAPKKILCLCSDGVTRAQLLKGKDDMRQDAVMQQVFGVVNQLLAKNKEMNKIGARIRTYKVVPLSRVRKNLKSKSENF